MLNGINGDRGDKDEGMTVSKALGDVTHLKEKGGDGGDGVVEGLLVWAVGEEAVHRLAQLDELRLSGPTKCYREMESRIRRVNASCFSVHDAQHSA